MVLVGMRHDCIKVQIQPQPRLITEFESTISQGIPASYQVIPPGHIEIGESFLQIEVAGADIEV